MNQAQIKNKILYAFIHKDKVLQVNKNNYGIELNKKYIVLIPKSLCYEIDKLCNIIKIGVVTDKEYTIDTIELPFQKIGELHIEMTGIDVWNELIDNNTKYNQRNKNREKLNYV